MITVKQTRFNGMLNEQPTLEYGDPLKALAHLVESELAFGGRVVEASTTCLKVVTRILSATDTSTFEGSAEEMRPLLTSAYLYEGASVEYSVDIATELAKGLKMAKGNPFLVSTLAPLLVGGIRLKAAILMSCGIQDAADVKAGLQARLGDLNAAIQLSKSGECTFREALAL